MSNYRYLQRSTSSSSVSGKYAPIVTWKESPFNEEGEVHVTETHVAETTDKAFVGISDRAILREDYQSNYRKNADVQNGLEVKAEIVGYNNLPTNLNKKYWFKFEYSDKIVVLGGSIGCAIRINSQGFVAVVEENDLTTIDYNDPSFVYYVEPKQKTAALPTTDSDVDSDDVEKEYGASEEVPAEAKTLTEDEVKDIVTKHNEDNEDLVRLYERRQELIKELSQNLDEVKAAITKRRKRRLPVTFPILPFFDWDFPLWDNWGPTHLSRYKPTLWGW